MSKGGGWFKTPNALIESEWFRGVRTAAELKVWLYLRSVARGDAEFFCKVATIGKATELGNGTVSRSIHALLAAGQLLLLERGRPGWASRYAFPDSCAGGTKIVAPVEGTCCAGGGSVVPPARKDSCAGEGALRPKTKTPSQRLSHKDGSAVPASPGESALLRSGFGWSKTRARELARRHTVDHIRDVIATVNANDQIESKLAYAESMFRRGTTPGMNGNGSKQHHNRRRHRSDDEQLGFITAGD